MRDVELAKVAAAFHDVIQYSHIDERQRPSKKRYREAGRNEVESAQAAVAYMNQVNEIALSHGRARVYFKEDIEKVREAILFTDPTGCWNDTLKTVVVPGDKFRRAGIIAQVVQLADLGASGMNPEIETYCSLALFTEENMDFREEMDTLLFRSARRHVTPEDKGAQDEKRAGYHQRLMQWFVGQDAFIAGRQKATESEINALNVPENLKKAVAALFPSSNFLESRQAEATLAAHYSKTTKFEDWAIDINDALVRVPRFS
jgi:hypothetical protein